MFTKMRKARRRRRFVKAYRILRKEADRHIQADHPMEFKAINESCLIMRCYPCPDLNP